MVLRRTASKEREGTGCVDRRSKQSAEQIQQEWSGKETHSYLHSKGIEMSFTNSKLWNLQQELNEEVLELFEISLDIIESLTFMVSLLIIWCSILSVIVFWLLFKKNKKVRM